MAHYTLNMKLQSIHNSQVEYDWGYKPIWIPISEYTYDQFVERWNQIPTDTKMGDLSSDFNDLMRYMNMSESKLVNCPEITTESGGVYTTYDITDARYGGTITYDLANPWISQWHNMMNMTPVFRPCWKGNGTYRINLVDDTNFTITLDFHSGSCVWFYTLDGGKRLTRWVHWDNNATCIGFTGDNSSTPANACYFEAFCVTKDERILFIRINGWQKKNLSSCTYGALSEADSAVVVAAIKGGHVPDSYNVTYHLVHATGDSENPTSVSVDVAEGQDVFMRFSPTEGYDLKYASVPIGTGYGPDDSVIYVWNAERGEMMIRGFTSDITVEVIGVVKPYPIDPSEPTDPSTIDPDSPNYDFTSDIIPVPPKPAWDYSKAGFCNVYVPTAQQLNFLAQYLWSSSFDADNFKKMFNNPMEAIIGCHLIPLGYDDLVLDEGYLAYGNNSTNIRMATARETWVDIDCGYIKIPVYYSAYMSYGPYTKIQIFLPFIGMEFLDPDVVVGKYLGLTYKFDIVSGTCLAILTVAEEPQNDDSVVYQFTGMCSSEIPVTQGDYKNILQTLQSVVSSSVGIASTAVTGRNSKTGQGLTKSGAAGMIGSAFSAIGALGSSIEDMIKPNISITGNVSSTAGFLGVKYPYLVITTPRVCIPDEQAEYKGYPTYVTATLGDLSGYTECEAVHLEGFSLTELELQELHDMLQEGVIF